MKKIACLLMVFILSLFFVGCNANETTKTGNEKGEKQVQEASVDLKDESILLDFIYENFEIELERELLIDNMTAVYGDFNGDGNDDAAYYSPDRNGFYEVAFITADNGELALIPSYIVKDTIYTHDVTFDGKFIHYTVTGGGTGIGTTVKRLYVYNGDKIKDTGASLIIDGYEAIPPWANNPDGYQSKTTGEIDGSLTDFIYTYTKSNEITGAIEEKSQSRYVYDANTYTYSITKLEADKKVK